MLVRYISIGVLWLLINRLAVADPRLGGNMSDFRSTLGTPFQQQVLVRTAILKWNKPRMGGRAIALGIFAVEVAFLDERACEIVLRSRKKISRDSLYRLVNPFVENFQGTRMPKPKSDFPSSTEGGSMGSRLNI